MGKRKKTIGETKVSMIDKIMEKKEIIVGIAGVLATLYPIINFMYNVFYQSECESFYGVPGKYFHSTIDNRLLYIGCIAILMIICTVPAIIKKIEEKKGLGKKGTTVYAAFLAIIIGIEIGFFNVYNLIEIMKQTHKTNDFFRRVNIFLDSNAAVTIMVVVFLGSVALLGITLIDIIKIIKWKWVKNIVSGIFAVSFALSLLLMIYGTIFKMSIRIEDKTKYEFVAIEDEEYVILTECDEKVLVTKYEMKENGQYIFNTGQYCFLEKYQGTYWYVNLEYGLVINSSGEKVYE